MVLFLKSALFRGEDRGGNRRPQYDEVGAWLRGPRVSHTRAALKQGSPRARGDVRVCLQRSLGLWGEGVVRTPLLTVLTQPHTTQAHKVDKALGFGARLPRALQRCGHGHFLSQSFSFPICKV